MFFREALFLYQGRLSIQTLHCIVYTNWLVDFKETIFLYKNRLSIQNLQWAGTHIQACLSQLAFCSTRRKAHNHVSERSSELANGRTLGPHIGSAHLGAHIRIAHLDRRTLGLHIWTAHLLCTFNPLCFRSSYTKAYIALWERTLAAPKPFVHPDFAVRRLYELASGLLNLRMFF